MKYKCLIVSFITLLFLTGCNPATKQAAEPQTHALQPPMEQPANATPADHQTLIAPDTKLIYTRHARCRMSCRHISEADIREVLREGHINEAKSKQEPGRCPAYAIEDERNSDHIRLRIVFAKCETEVKVVTCIDRDDEFQCDCK